VIGETVSVAIITFNSARYIRRCLESVLTQDCAPLDVVVIDNASTDATPSILAEFEPLFGDRLRVLRNDLNSGFACAQNQAIAATKGAWVLTLNPDVLLEPSFLRSLLDAAASDPTIGAVCGKLLSIGPGFRPLPVERIDSAGIVFTPTMRHLDRGWHELDGYRFDVPGYVFGATAAAALYRRDMIADVSIEGEFFDPSFFVYREDADVAWRAQLLGWRCLYVPAAVGRHVRTVTPANRRSMPAFINMHSVKNRFLMRIKNATPELYRRYWLPMTARDLLVVAGCLCWEFGSLPAFWKVAAQLPRALRHRRVIMSRKRIPSAELTAWFSADAPQPTLQPAADWQPAPQLLANPVAPVQN
jgi:GT2 family glycosyltransferase